MPVSNTVDAFSLPMLLGVLVAYALGCFNTGYYLVRWKTGRDIRGLGSGNTGAKNAGRALGPWGFGASLLGDMVKGVLVVRGAQLGGFSTLGQGLMMVAVIAGHNWPAQLGFRGGKGAATSFGALLFFDPVVAVLMFGVCAVFLALSRRFTVSAMAAYGLSPVLGFLVGRGAVEAVIFGIVAGLVLFPHWKNLREELDRGPAMPKM
jgi:glycerol-3-phosphate acyltransferase PlsY